VLSLEGASASALRAIRASRRHSASCLVRTTGRCRGRRHNHACFARRKRARAASAPVRLALVRCETDTGALEDCCIALEGSVRRQRPNVVVFLMSSVSAWTPDWGCTSSRAWTVGSFSCASPGVLKGVDYRRASRRSSWMGRPSARESGSCALRGDSEASIGL
jgi:hypothetical protein